MDYTTAKGIYRVMRAMQDGVCPRCHTTHQLVAMRFTDFKITDNSVQPPLGYVTCTGWRCPFCKFQITDEEGAKALLEFKPFMERSLGIFEDWRKTL